MTQTIERKLIVCAKKGCMKCPFYCEVVPDTCEWGMKHLLETNEDGVVIDLPRRGGKTRDLKRRVRELASLDVPIMIFVPTQDLVRDMQRDLMGTGVLIMSLGGWNVRRQQAVGKVHKELGGRDGMAVFSDEVHPWIADCVNEMKRHKFILGYYSSVG